MRNYILLFNCYLLILRIANIEGSVVNIDAQELLSLLVPESDPDAPAPTPLELGTANSNNFSAPLDATLIFDARECILASTANIS